MSDLKAGTQAPKNKGKLLYSSTPDLNDAISVLVFFCFSVLLGAMMGDVARLSANQLGLAIIMVLIFHVVIAFESQRFRNFSAYEKGIFIQGTLLEELAGRGGYWLPWEDISIIRHGVVGFALEEGVVSSRLIIDRSHTLHICARGRWYLVRDMALLSAEGKKKLVRALGKERWKKLFREHEHIVFPENDILGMKATLARGLPPKMKNNGYDTFLVFLVPSLLILGLALVLGAGMGLGDLSCGILVLSLLFYLAFFYRLLKKEHLHDGANFQWLYLALGAIKEARTGEEMVPNDLREFTTLLPRFLSKGRKLKRPGRLKDLAQLQITFQKTARERALENEGEGASWSFYEELESLRRTGFLSELEELRLPEEGRAAATKTKKKMKTRPPVMRRGW